MWFRRVEEIEDIPVPSSLHEHPELVSLGSEAPQEFPIQGAPIDKNKKEKYQPADFQRVRLLRLERYKNESDFIFQKPNCPDHGCNSLRAFTEDKDGLRINAFCVAHECKDEDCTRHVVSEKPFCVTHYCTKKNCEKPRDGHPQFPTLCYTHREQACEEALAPELAAVEETRTRGLAAAEETRTRGLAAAKETRERKLIAAEKTLACKLAIVEKITLSKETERRIIKEFRET